MGADANSSVDDQSLSVRQIIDLAPVLIHTARPDEYLDFFNRRWLDFSGQPLEKLLGWGWTYCIHPDEVELFFLKMRESFAKGEYFQETSRVRRPDGVYRWMLHLKVPLRDADGIVIKWIGSSIDIEERKRAEEELRTSAQVLQRNEFCLTEAQRLGHIGSRAPNITTVAELSASIAHELNQPLMAVPGNVQAAKRWLATNPPNLVETTASIERILKAIRSADETMQHIRTLFKRESFEKTEANVPDMIREAVRLVHEDPKKRADLIDWDFDGNLPTVYVDLMQIQQVLCNLILNAIEAMEGSRTDSLLRVRAAVTDQKKMLIQVSDNGPGVDNTETIFDAFVTTKDKGMGIGLAVSRSIVEVRRAAMG